MESGEDKRTVNQVPATQWSGHHKTGSLVMVLDDVGLPVAQPKLLKWPLKEPKRNPFKEAAAANGAARQRITMREIPSVATVFVESFNKVEDMLFLGVYRKNLGMKKTKPVALPVLLLHPRLCGTRCCPGDGAFLQLPGHCLLVESIRSRWTVHESRIINCKPQPRHAILTRIAKTEFGFARRGLCWCAPIQNMKEAPVPRSVSCSVPWLLSCAFSHAVPGSVSRAVSCAVLSFIIPHGEFSRPRQFWNLESYWNRAWCHVARGRRH